MTVAMNVAVMIFEGSSLQVFARGSGEAPMMEGNEAAICQFLLQSTERTEMTQYTVYGLATRCQLWPGNWYDAVLPGSAVVAVVGGKAASDDIVWRFQTPDNTALRVTEFTPHQKDAVDEHASIHIFFSKAIAVSQTCTQAADCVVKITSSVGETKTLALISGITDSTMASNDPTQMRISYQGSYVQSSGMLHIPKQIFSEQTGGWASRTSYSITLQANHLADMGGNYFAGGIESFVTDDNYAPNIVEVTASQSEFKGAVEVNFVLDEPTTVLEGGEGGTFDLVNMNTGVLLTRVSPRSEADAVSYQPGKFKVRFSGALIPSAVPVSVQWSTGAVVDDAGNAVIGYSAEDYMEGDAQHKFTSTEARTPKTSLGWSDDGAGLGYCWDVAAEERALTEFEVVATENPETFEWTIDLKQDGVISEIVEILHERTGHWYTAPEIEQMIHAVNDGNDILNARDYVAARCPFEPKERLPPVQDSETAHSWVLGRLGQTCSEACTEEGLGCIDAEFGVVDYYSCAAALTDAKHDKSRITKIGIIQKEMPQFPLPLLVGSTCYATTAASFCSAAHPRYEPLCKCVLADDPNDQCAYQNDYECDARGPSSKAHCPVGSDSQDCGRCRDDNNILVCAVLSCKGCAYNGQHLPGTTA
jgi:hypothetical protein